jgi:hypothetical protein
MNLQRHETPRIRTPHGSGPLGRRSGREGGQALTVGFRRYVEAVLSPDHSLAKDLQAALNLTQDIMEYERRPEIDAALIASYAKSMRQTATAVRQAGRSAVAHPALLARAIVLARTLDRTAAGRQAKVASGDGDRVLQTA